MLSFLLCTNMLTFSTFRCCCVVLTRQVGLDRIVVFEFHTGYKLICEFYSAGNMILTNDQNIIIGLLRVHDFNEEDKIRVG